MATIRKPSGISIDPQGNIWTTSWVRATLTVTTADGQQLRSISTARSPTQVRFGGDLAFFTSELGGKIVAVDAQTLAPAYQIHAKAILPGVYINRGIGYYVASYRQDPGVINMFNPASGRPLGSVSTGILTPRGLAFNRAGTIMVTASKTQNELVEMSVKDRSVINAFPVGLTPRAVLIADHSAFTANMGDGTVTRVDLGTGLSTTIVVGSPDSGPRRMVSSGRRLYVALQNDNVVQVVDLRTNMVRRTLRLDGSPRQLAFDATRKRLYVANLGSDKVVSFHSGRRTKRVAPIQASSRPPLLDVSLLLPLYRSAF